MASNSDFMIVKEQLLYSRSAGKPILPRQIGSYLQEMGRLRAASIKLKGVGKAASSDQQGLGKAPAPTLVLYTVFQYLI
jgi:hypothetical protein